MVRMMYPVDFYTPHPPEYVNSSNDDVGLKELGLMLFPQDIVWIPAAVVPMNVRFLYPAISALVMEQLV